jgi:prophage regulatory protein
MDKASKPSPTRPIRIGRVRHLTGDPSDATIWRWVNNDPTFPKPFHMSSAITCWDEAEIMGWVESKKAARAEQGGAL